MKEPEPRFQARVDAALAPVRNILDEMRQEMADLVAQLEAKDE